MQGMSASTPQLFKQTHRQLHVVNLAINYDHASVCCLYLLRREAEASGIQVCDFNVFHTFRCLPQYQFEAVIFTTLPGLFEL